MVITVGRVPHIPFGEGRERDGFAHEIICAQLKDKLG